LQRLQEEDRLETLAEGSPIIEGFYTGGLHHMAFSLVFPNETTLSSDAARLFLAPGSPVHQFKLFTISDIFQPTLKRVSMRACTPECPCKYRYYGLKENPNDAPPTPLPLDDVPFRLVLEPFAIKEHVALIVDLQEANNYNENNIKGLALRITISKEQRYQAEDLNFLALKFVGNLELDAFIRIGTQRSELNYEIYRSAPGLMAIEFPNPCNFSAFPILLLEGSVEAYSILRVSIAMYTETEFHILKFYAGNLSDSVLSMSNVNLGNYSLPLDQPGTKTWPSNANVYNLPLSLQINAYIYCDGGCQTKTSIPALLEFTDNIYKDVKFRMVCEPGVGIVQSEQTPSYTSVNTTYKTSVSTCESVISIDYISGSLDSLELYCLGGISVAQVNSIRTDLLNQRAEQAQLRFGNIVVYLFEHTHASLTPTEDCVRCIQKSISSQNKIECPMCPALSPKSVGFCEITTCDYFNMDAVLYACTEDYPCSTPPEYTETPVCPPWLTGTLQNVNYSTSFFTGTYTQLVLPEMPSTEYGFITEGFSCYQLKFSSNSVTSVSLAAIFINGSDVSSAYNYELMMESLYVVCHTGGEQLYNLETVTWKSLYFLSDIGFQSALFGYGELTSLFTGGDPFTVAVKPCSTQCTCTGTDLTSFAIGKGEIYVERAAGYTGRVRPYSTSIVDQQDEISGRDVFAWYMQNIFLTNFPSTSNVLTVNIDHPGDIILDRVYWVCSEISAMVKQYPDHYTLTSIQQSYAGLYETDLYSYWYALRQRVYDDLLKTTTDKSSLDAIFNTDPSYDAGITDVQFYYARKWFEDYEWSHPAEYATVGPSFDHQFSIFSTALNLHRIGESNAYGRSNFIIPMTVCPSKTVPYLAFSMTHASGSGPIIDKAPDEVVTTWTEGAIDYVNWQGELRTSGTLPLVTDYYQQKGR